MIEAIALDGKNSVVIEPTADGWPPLLFVLPQEVDGGAVEHLLEIFKDGKDRLPVLLIGDIVVFQLIDGRWQRLI